MKKMIQGTLIFIICYYGVLYAPAISYSSPTSQLKISGSSKLSPTNMLLTSGGTLATSKNATLEGVNYTFQSATLAQVGKTNVAASGTLNPTQNTFAVNNQTINASAGFIGQTITVGGKNSVLEGFTSAFTNPNTIVLTDSSTVLNIALISPLSTSIALNKGTVKLISDLKVSGSSTIFGDGTILFNARTLTFDGTARTFGGTVLMDNATDIVFDGRITLTGQWIFTGTGVIAGMGNILDLSYGGTIRIKAGSEVTLTGLKIRGLGTGKILLDHPTSKLRLTSVEIEMNQNYTFTTGGIYAEGPTTIITKDKNLAFSQAASLTVDGIGLNYDTLSFSDQANIQPFPDVGMAHVTLLNNGVIRHLVASIAGGITDLHFTQNSFLHDLIVVQPERRLFLDATLSLSGGSNIVLFACSHQDLVFVTTGAKVNIYDASLQYFSPSFVRLSPGAALIFNDLTKINFAKNEDLNSTWTFQGHCVLNGKDHTLTLGRLGEIVLGGRGSSLLLENLSVRGLHANKIRCLDNTCTISFNNVDWNLDRDFSFTTGHFEVVSDFVLTGTAKFVYSSSRQSVIGLNAMLRLDNGLTLSYDPPNNQRNLIALTDPTAALFMNGATLASTRTGLLLTRGQLIIDNKNFLRNDGAQSVSQSITLGNGVAEHDILVKLLPGGNINTLSGQLVYNNTM